MISTLPSQQQGPNISHTPDENASTLRPWSTPRLQCLNGETTTKHFVFWTEKTYTGASLSFGPS
jgi:hypothetical protein